MRPTAKRTLLAAALLALLAAAAPFLCLTPLFAPATAPAATAAPGSLAEPDSEAAPDSPAATAAPDSKAEADGPAATPQPVLVWDEAAGQALRLPAEEYLIGAAACEMPPDWPDAALQAQMVASHSWALYQLEQGDAAAAVTVNSAQCSGWTSAEVLRSRWGEDFDANWQRLAALAEEVAGTLLLYDGRPALACYHAISCGHTQASGRVWAQTLPYLQGVDSAWDAQADGFAVTVQYTAQQVSDALSAGLGIAVSGDPGSWVGQASYDAAGYVEHIALCGQTVSGVQLRQALSLRSACFAIAWQDGQFQITTYGYGHGVGLSQAGARAMAAGGSSWQEILLYYFPGTVLSPANEVARR